MKPPIKEWSETLINLYGAGKIAKAAYDFLMGRIQALEANADALEAGAGVVEDVELTAEIAANAAEIAAAVAAAAA